MRLRHVLYLAGSIVVVVFALASLWAFVLENWVLASHFAASHQGEGTAEGWEYVASATGVALAALILPLWISARAVRDRDRAEEALRESETWLKEGARIAKLGHFIWDDVENRCIYCDEEFARIHGITPEKYLSTSATFEDDLLWVHPDDRERYRTVIIEESLQNRRHTNVEYRIVRRDGEIRHILERGKPVLDRIGFVIRTIGTIQDITERKQAEAALQAAHDSLEERVKERTAELQLEIAHHRETEHALRGSEERYRELFDDSPVAIWEEDWSPIKQMLDDLARGGVKDWRGYFNSHRDQLRTAYDLAKITEISLAAIDIYRAASKEELVRWSAAPFVIDEELDAFREIVLSFLAGQMTVEIESKDTAVGESEIMVRRRVVIPPKYCDDWSRVIYAIEDITERKRAEEALRRGEARLTAIMENAPAEIYLKDVQGRYVLINRYYEKLWGVTKEGVKGKLPADIHHQKEFADAARSHDVAVLGSGEVIEQEDDILMADGLHTLHMIKFPIRDAAGEISGLGAIATDVTESKKLDRIKDEFVSSVSHELRTPMASVLGALGLIQGGAAGRLPEKAQSMIEITYRNCNRLVRLLNDVLDIEKMESGNSNFEKSLLELGPLARDAIETIAHYSAEHHVEVRLVEDVEFVEVMADGDRLIQVLTNLLSNAIKFSPQGGVVEVRISRSGHAVRLSVKDCGPGIPADFHDQVFERFTQADRADGRCRSGTGLGLSICKMIIDQHDGSIAFDTGIGTGTAFYFDLPEGRGKESSAESAGTASRLHREPLKRQGGQR